MGKKAAKTTKPSLRHVEVPIEWQVDVSAVFANQLLVQIDEHECHLSFFEIEPPVLVGSAEQRKAAITKLKSVPARCVARVVVSGGRLQGFADAIQGAIDKLRDANARGKKNSRLYG